MVEVSASAWVRRFVPLLAPGGAVLDLAAGQGRHTRLLLEHGFAVTAVDRDPSALVKLGPHPRLFVVAADLESAPWPLPTQQFAGVVITNYLWRPLWPAILAAIGADGVLLAETFAVGNQRFGKPTNPAFLLRPGELLEVVAPHLTVVAFEQGKVEQPRPAVVQRICAVRLAADTWPVPVPT